MGNFLVKELLEQQAGLEQQKIRWKNFIAISIKAGGRVSKDTFQQLVNVERRLMETAQRIEHAKKYIRG